ncbi:DUF551 domain-containing protein [Enterobacter hormaechei]|uniref:DUF551 domain-containing protein n=1 Tax=Enterobacter cloacae complex TaxID=354276 RepID=UPI00100A0C0E|nr:MULTISPECIES: DUF551 domain-containing protein [Enterobacter cloacae complex]ELX8430287.1 DUF551 domain-containing protein [Enterobacter hormaechei subsp. hoffmannii]EKP1099117.1 DUF551 domain-containing protein [Enterobacter hormaechei]EKU5018130.1 DUF551 domain-containing protein [Enterobacter hormaechei]EKW1080959.1 DUF551 domain-containing protein [Enterobacter hormaechei]ELD3478368.1 DUF551 domain-containing protein [Enterobacter hormaechei]
MSNIDKHAVQTVADLKAGYTLGHADVAILNELARIALASLEAEPAIHRWRRVTFEPYGPYPWHYGNFIGFSKPVDGIEDEYYYAAPPAPVSVPAAMEMDDDFDSAFEHGKAVGWNAYRAAMLQSFGNSEQLNSPVIPDGWVACSEQMPEENAEQEVLACFKGGDISTLYYFEGRWDDAYGIVPIRQDVTHWMPLPSAPQQEA